MSLGPAPTPAGALGPATAAGRLGPAGPACACRTGGSTWTSLYSIASFVVSLILLLYRKCQPTITSLHTSSACVKANVPAQHKPGCTTHARSSPSSTPPISRPYTARVRFVLRSTSSARGGSAPAPTGTDGPAAATSADIVGSCSRVWVGCLLWGVDARARASIMELETMDDQRLDQESNIPSRVSSCLSPILLPSPPNREHPLLQWQSTPYPFLIATAAPSTPSVDCSSHLGKNDEPCDQPRERLAIHT